MRWRKTTCYPTEGQLVWVMTYPHKKTVASLELHCGWVEFPLRSDSTPLWRINNMDEVGSGSIAFDAFAEYDYAFDKCKSETIMAWIPAKEFIYPEWLESLSVE